MLTNDSQKSAVDVVTALHNFYESFFPVRSQFELPAGFRNRFLHVSELRAWRQSQAHLLMLARAGLGATLVVFVCYLYWNKVKQFRRYLFRVSSFLN